MGHKVWSEWHGTKTHVKHLPGVGVESVGGNRIYLSWLPTLLLLPQGCFIPQGQELCQYH
jgi:hypothetical protein